MIISHRYRFIFIKTRKSAGSSIEMALSKYCGPSDVITPISDEEDRDRTAMGYPGPQNIRVPISRFTRYEILKMIKTRLRPEIFYHRHMQAADVRRRVARRVWDTYFKFCVERDPWDKAISLYYWRTRGRLERPSILEYLNSVDRKDLSNWHFYTDNDQVIVDKVMRYESLSEELTAVSQQLGLPGDLAKDIQPFNAKGNVRADRRDYASILGKEEQEIIDRMCSDEIRRFNY